jgi:hypothetical protein
MDLNSLSGKDLDKYGESQGIPRYQGLGLPEDDDSYRKSIRQELNMGVDVKESVQPKKWKQVFHCGQDPLYGVLVVDSDDGSIIRIAAEYNGNGMAIYTSRYQALDQAAVWANHDKVSTFEVREINLFEV